MSYELTGKLRNLVPYQPITGAYKIRLDANESFLPPEKELVERLGNAVSGVDFNRYPDPFATNLCKTFATCYNLDADCVTAGNGSDELIGIILSSFLKRGETVLTLEPDFSMYKFYAALSECQVQSLAKQNDLKIEPDAVLDALKKTGARLLIFSNPCNPTSLGLCRADVLQIIEGTDALVVLDEAYMDFWDESVLQTVCNYDNVILLKTCSKAVGAAAIRLGFAVACKRLTTAIRAAKSPYNVSSLTQAAGEILLLEQSMLQRAVAEILRSRDELQTALDAMEIRKCGINKVYCSCTNFIFLELCDAKMVYEMLLQQSIAVRLMGKHLRITAGTREENAALLAALEQILEDKA